MVIGRQRQVRFDDSPEEIAAAFEVDSYEDIHPNALDALERRTNWQDYLARQEAEHAEDTE